MDFEKPTQQMTARERTAALVQIMRENHYDPLLDLITIAKSHDTSDEQRVDIAKTLLPYVYPKLKHVEVDAQVQNGITVNITQFIKPENNLSLPQAVQELQTTQTNLLEIKKEGLIDDNYKPHNERLTTRTIEDPDAISRALLQLDPQRIPGDPRAVRNAEAQPSTRGFISEAERGNPDIIPDPGITKKNWATDDYR